MLNRRFSFIVLCFLTIISGLAICGSSIPVNLTNLRYSKASLQILEKKGPPWSLLFQEQNWSFTGSISTPAKPVDSPDSHVKPNILVRGNLSRNYLSGLADLFNGDFSSVILLLQEDLASGTRRSGLIPFLLGTAYGLNGSQEKAIQSWRQDPETVSYFLREGAYALYNQQDPGLAVKFFTVATEVDPANCEALYRLGISLIELRKKEEALNVLEKTDQSTCPIEFLGEIDYQLGILLADSGDLDRGIEYARQSLNLNGDDIKRLSLLGTLLIKQGDNLDEAMNLLNKAVLLDPGNIWNYINPCNTYRQQEEFSLALQWCQKAVERFPENAIGFHYLGLVYLDSGSFNKAIVWLSKAAKLDATNVNTWNRLGDAYRRTRDVQGALDAYRAALQISPDDLYARQSVDALSKGESSGEVQK